MKRLVIVIVAIFALVTLFRDTTPAGRDGHDEVYAGIMLFP